MSDEPNIETVPITDWWLFQRVHEVESAARINLLRAAGLILFYGVHLFTYLNRDPNDTVFAAYHALVTKISFAWLVLTVAVALALKLRVFPPLSKFVTTIIDVTLLTCIAMAGEKAMSGVVIVYPLIIAMTFLRFSAPLVLTATVASLLGYYVLVAATDPVWFDADHEVPLNQQGVTALTLILTGIVGWFVCNTTKKWFETQAQLRQDHESRVPKSST